MKRLYDCGIVLLLGLCVTGLLRFPQESAQAAREALQLCAVSVVPSLFPFFVLSSLLIESGYAQRLGRLLRPLLRPLLGMGDAAVSAFAMGIVGGYPVGARSIAALYREGAIGREEAEVLLAFCNNAGPGFILGVCGAGIFESTRMGLYLYLIHVAAALIVGMRQRRHILQIRKRAFPVRQEERKSALTAFPTAVQSSCSAILNVCAFIVLFMVLLRLLLLFAATFLPQHLLQNTGAIPLMAWGGLIEMTNGIAALHNTPESFIFAAMLLGWGGLSVHAQTLAMLADCELSTRYYFVGKLQHGIFSCVLAWIAARFLFT